MVIHLVYRGNQAAKLQAFEVGIAAVGDVMVRMIDILLTNKRENDVVGIKIPRRLERFVALEFHPFSQMEGVDLTVLAHLPALRQARHQLRCARLKIDQPVIDRHGAGIHAGSRGV